MYRVSMELGFVLGTVMGLVLEVAMPSAVCSWYGEPFHGRQTASGIEYNMFGFSCAHRTLPLGTQVLFWCPETGQYLEARVEDRGPYVAGRDFDLSMAAARWLTKDLDQGVYTLEYMVTGRDTTGLLYNL
jgi:rare lipoprotein A